jgi:hypothetical protein
LVHHRLVSVQEKIALFSCNRKGRNRPLLASGDCQLLVFYRLAFAFYFQ